MTTNKRNLRLDVVGQAAAAFITAEEPGTFSVAAHLHDIINPELLQAASDDVFARLPYLSGTLKRGSFWFIHEVLAEPPIIARSDDSPAFSHYYYEGEGHVVRVLYSDTVIRVQAIHSIIDGRSLAKVLMALLIRYYELLGLDGLDKTGFIDCDMPYQREESANCYTMFAQPLTAGSRGTKQPPKRKVSAFHFTPSLPVEGHVISKSLDARRVKQAARANNATVTEYLIATAFMEMRKERHLLGGTKPLGISVPVDLRRFFPTESLRNFIVEQHLTAPETEDFSQMVSGIQSQLHTSDQGEAQQAVNSMQWLFTVTRWLPLALKATMWRLFKRRVRRKTSSTFSNLGHMDLPVTLAPHVQNLEFIISPQKHEGFALSVITLGDVLTLSISVGNDDSITPSELLQRLDKHRLR